MIVFCQRMLENPRVCCGNGFSVDSSKELNLMDPLVQWVLWDPKWLRQRPYSSSYLLGIFACGATVRIGFSLLRFLLIANFFLF